MKILKYIFPLAISAVVFILVFWFTGLLRSVGEYFRIFDRPDPGKDEREQHYQDESATLADGTPVTQELLAIYANELYRLFGFGKKFGLFVPWEDEEAIVQTILSHTPQSFDLLVMEYRENPETSANLVSHIEKYLSDDDRAKIRHVTGI